MSNKTLNRSHGVFDKWMQIQSDEMNLDDFDFEIVVRVDGLSYCTTYGIGIVF